MTIPHRKLTLLCLITLFCIYPAFAQEFTEDDLIELTENYSFINPFIGEITVSYPDGWEIEGDVVSGGIFMGEALDYSSSTGTVIGTPTNIMIVGYPSEVDISDYDEEVIFENYATNLTSTIDLEEAIEGTLVELDDRLFYHFTFALSGMEITFVFWHEEGEFIALQATTTDDDVDLLPLVLSVAHSLQLNRLETMFDPIELTSEHTLTLAEGVVTFNYPDAWTVQEIMSRSVFIGNDVDNFDLEGDELPAFGVYGIVIVVSPPVSNSSSNDASDAEEMLRTFFGDEVNTGTIDLIEKDNIEGALHVRLVENSHLAMTMVFYTENELFVAMRAFVTARDVAQFRPIFMAVAQTFNFTSQEG